MDIESKVKELEKSNEYLCKKLFELSSDVIELMGKARLMRVYITALFIMLIILFVVVMALWVI